MRSIMGALLRTSSRHAIDAALPERKAVDDTPIVSPKKGKRGKFCARLITYERGGPFHRQVGIKWLHGECWPIMQTYFKHRWLHATKGWREYTGGPSMRLPVTSNQGAVPRRISFYGHHRFAM